MRHTSSPESDLLKSTLADEGVVPTTEIQDWLAERRQANRYAVRRLPLAEIKGWHIDQETGNFAHDGGAFFSIEGIEVETNFGSTCNWTQPIVNQAEVGILGFLAKNIDGLLHVLVQAKMEPGNVGLVQLSPTVQATRSNYTRAHGGARPRFLDYFLARSKTRVLADQLQSENNARFLWKRNRNMIVEVAPDEAPQRHDDFRWVTLGQLNAFLGDDNAVNMDARTVLSSVRMAGADPNRWSVRGGFAQSVLTSALARDGEAEFRFNEIISWLADLRTSYELRVRRIPLGQVKSWHRTADAIQHESARYFSVIGVSVDASSREVSHWCQPLIEPADRGVIALVCQERAGVLHLLMQGRVEAGTIDVVELAPTVQCVATNYQPADLPPLYARVAGTSGPEIRFDSVQSEEGGRFFRSQNRYRIIELPPGEAIQLPPNYMWITLAQVKELLRFSNIVNVEARSLVACIMCGVG